jgi:predicted Zn-dependent protease
VTDAAELLELCGADHVEVLRERQELLRFGASRITYQHSEEKLTLRARRGRVWCTVGSDEPEAVRALRPRFESEPRGEVEPPAGEPRPAETAFAATEAATPEDRVELFRASLAALPGGAELGGSIAHTVVRQSIANVAGLERDETRTRALVQLVASQDGRSSYARAVHRDAAQLPDLSAVADGLAPLPLRTLEPGRYRAALGPEAMIVLASTLGQIGFHPSEGAFADRLGQRVLGENVTLVDDGADPAGLPTGFDCEGTPKQRVPLVENGVVVGVIRRETGHAVPPAWRFGGGPSPSHVLVSPGEASDDDLLAACGTGLQVQRVNYVRVVHPSRTLVTGSSRDATLWLENGRPVARLPQFRFTLRLDELFSSLEALGSRRVRGEAVFMESIVAPGAVASSFPVDVVTG